MRIGVQGKHTGGMQETAQLGDPVGVTEAENREPSDNHES
jgi:hypothetical protein